MQGTEIDMKQEAAEVENRQSRGPILCPRTDIREAEDHFSIEVDLPGVTPKDVHLQEEEGELRITATRSDADGSAGNRVYLIRERRRGTYSRVFHLGGLVDRDAIEGKLSDGVLMIRIPKHQSAMPRRIAVN